MVSIPNDENTMIRAQQLENNASELFEVFRNIPDRSKIEQWLGREVTDSEYRTARIDYTTLCCATQADGPLPYESVYKSDERRFMGDCVDEVKLAYRLIGYEIPEDLSREPEDHIAIELDFMRYAYRRAADNEPERNELLDLADSFKEDHVDSWFIDYASEGLDVIDGEFYRKALDKLRDFARC